MDINMDKILTASFGESSNTIRANFKKTINIRQYETEVIELSTVLELEREVSGIERMLISAILQAQLEYEAYIQLRCKEIVNDTQLVTRRGELEHSIKLLVNKAEVLTGKSMQYIFELAV